MHKAKKKTKTVKLPKPIKVKKEKSDEERLPQPMTHYIDDRLEMIKQIFNTLKPKTILNLAPEFLKTQSLEEIEESCLNELLCISTKRLKSIITATNCPSDTESSDNDSDVERHEEHISLEEISSDSEFERTGSKNGKRKKSANGGEQAVKKNTPNPNNQDDGQISVLELLELQARARAIRSQLALEPVTKIEVDSDGEKCNKQEKNKSLKRFDNTNKNERTRYSSERDNRDSAKNIQDKDSTHNFNSNIEKEAEKKKTTNIKLKRTHRSSANKEKHDDIQKTMNKKNSKDKIKEEAEKYMEQDKNRKILITNIKKEKSSRSPSPDVIPIVAEQETLLVKDSSDDETGKESKKSTDDNNTMYLDNRECKNSEKTPQDGEGNKESSPTFKENKIATPSVQDMPKPSDNVGIESCADNINDSQIEVSGYENIENTEEYKDIENTIKAKNCKAIDLTKKFNEETNSATHSDDDGNDDVISLGGDLENEMNEQLENEVDGMQSLYNKKSAEDSLQSNKKSQDESLTEDAISLNSSEDEQVHDNQSWHSRYLNSSKVSKVLATSRLGKRVRDNIKKSKHSKKETSRDNSDAEKEKTTPVFTSKHEDGSIEQYKELLEMRQCKSSS